MFSSQAKTTSPFRASDSMIFLERVLQVVAEGLNSIVPDVDFEESDGNTEIDSTAPSCFAPKVSAVLVRECERIIDELVNWKKARIRKQYGSAKRALALIKG